MAEKKPKVSASQIVPRNKQGVREKIHEVIFEADTPMGLLFDVALLVAIVASVIVVCADTVEGLHAKFGGIFWALEWFFTVLFTIEYVFRLYCVRRPWKYALSFFGMIDLLAILPTYLGVFLSNTPSLARSMSPANGLTRAPKSPKFLPKRSSSKFNSLANWLCSSR